MLRAALAFLAAAAATATTARLADPMSGAAERAVVGAGAAQDYPYHPYSGRFTFVRIRTNMGGGGGFSFGRGRGRDPGWRHDYPDADRNFSKILNELTYVHTLVDDWGGNVLTFDDERLSQFPIAYVSEPGQWTVTPEEAKALRDYLLKGGFVIFDDFGGNQGRYDMDNLAQQMAIVVPELQWVRLDSTDEIFDSFFQLDPDNLELAATDASYRGVPVFYGLYENNDRENGRLIVIAGDAGDFGEFWEFSERGYYPVDISNEAYKVGINYIVYALTH
jgi:hypothetical protein